MHAKTCEGGWCFRSKSNRRKDYMESAKILLGKRYPIRRLNQAYFVFMAHMPIHQGRGTAKDPVGPVVRAF
jgi:hypothetical protein